MCTQRWKGISSYAETRTVTVFTYIFDPGKRLRDAWPFSVVRDTLCAGDGIKDVIVHIRFSSNDLLTPTS